MLTPEQIVKSSCANKESCEAALCWQVLLKLNVGGFRIANTWVRYEDFLRHDYYRWLINEVLPKDDEAMLLFCKCHFHSWAFCIALLSKDWREAIESEAKKKD